MGRDVIGAWAVGSCPRRVREERVAAVSRHEASINPAVWQRPGMRVALARRDIGAVYRMLAEAGISQRQIAELTGQSQSEVSEILRGRQVRGYDLLVRIADGLGAERGWMALAYAEDTCPPPSPTEEEVDEDVKRRALLAAGGVALFDRPVLGELLHLPERPHTPTPLPSRLGAADVDAIRELTRRLDAVAKAYGGYTEMLTPVASRAEKLLSVPGSEATKTGLTIAIAELHTVAGWAAFDAHSDDNARYHFARAMALGGDAGDGFAFSKAAYLAGVATAERGHYNDGLKLIQLGQIRLDQTLRDPRTGELTSWLGVDSADMLAHLNRPDAARSALAAARDTWQAPDADDQAEMEWLTALIELNLGRLDVAEGLVATAVRHWDGTDDRRQAVLGSITLAAIHVQAGEPRGLELAHQAITRVAELRSVRARDRLVPLVAALEARPGGEARELAGLARRVTAT